MPRKLTWIQGATSAELRATFLQTNFLPRAEAIFARDEGVQSVILAIAQFYADEAEDAVHLDLIPSESREPTWPDCITKSPFYSDDEGCWECSPRGSQALGWSDGLPAPSHLPELSSNSSAITAFAAYCPEVASQEDSLNESFTPYAIARRNESGPAEMEIVGRIHRPAWEDRFDVGFNDPQGLASERLFENKWSAPAPAEPAAPSRRPSLWRRLFGRNRP